METKKIFSELNSSLGFLFLVFGTVGITMLTMPVWFDFSLIKNISNLYLLVLHIVLVLLFAVIAYIVWMTIFIIYIKLFVKKDAVVD